MKKHWSFMKMRQEPSIEELNDQLKSIYELLPKLLNYQGDVSMIISEGEKWARDWPASPSSWGHMTPQHSGSSHHRCTLCV